MDALGILIQECQVLEELVSLAGQVRQALVQSDPDQLKDLAERQEHLGKRLLELDGLRRALPEPGHNGKTSNLDDGQAEDDERLLSTYEDIRRQVRILQQANAVNHQLMAGIVRWADGFFKELQQVVDEASAYDQHGMRLVQPKSSLLMDHHI